MTRREIGLADLPAYLARLAAAADGGLWMALFAPRRQLFEMVLREQGYRQAMLESMPADEWIGPDFASSAAPEQPLQQGSVRQMGVMKPWAPSRSYGLVARCDADLSVAESWHSRADGTLHGITDLCPFRGAVYAAARGAGQLLRLEHAPAEEGP